MDHAKLFTLIRCSLSQSIPLNAVNPSSESIDFLLDLGSRHEVQPLAAYALLLSSNLPRNLEDRCRKAVYAAMLSDAAGAGTHLRPAGGSCT